MLVSGISRVELGWEIVQLSTIDPVGTIGHDGHLVEATHEQRATGWVKITTKPRIIPALVLLPSHLFLFILPLPNLYCHQFGFFDL